MRISSTLIAATSVALLCGGAYAYRITNFKAAPAAELNIPVLPDSTQKENRFADDKLLNARGALKLSDLSSWSKAEADSAGRVALSAGNTPTLHTYKTRLRAARFCKGKLILNTPQIADILVNGKSLSKKATADSLASDATAVLELRPEADYDIQLNILTLPDEKGEPEFKLEFIPDKDYEDVELSSGSEGSRRFTPLDTATGERVASVNISPDGKYYITKYYETFSSTETRYRATLTETATGKIVDDNIEYSAKWMPKGSTFFYTTEGHSGKNLYTADAATLRTKHIASEIPGDIFNMSPDGKYFYYYNKVDGPKDEGVMRRVKNPDDRIPGDRDRWYVMRYDTQTRVSVPLTFGGASTIICDFSKDGKKMLFQTEQQKPSEYPFYFKDLIEMDLSTLKTDTIISHEGFLTGAIYSPDASEVFIYGGPECLGGIGVNAGNHETPNSYDYQGFIYNIASKSAKAVTFDFDPSVKDGPIWNTADGNIYFRGDEGFGAPIFRLTPKDGKITRLETKVPNVFGFSMGDNNSQWLAYYGADFTDTGVAYLLNLKNGKSSLIDDPMQKTIGDVEFGKMKPWKFTASDGSLIDGYICLPPDFDATKKYPLIVYYYGGTLPSTAAMHHLYSPQVFASRDYVVYVLNPSGTTGYGQEFSARHVNAWGKQTANEIIEGTKKFLEAHSFVDPKKVGCIGASYGGFMTQYLQTLTDIFAAAVSHAGISNVTSYWGEGYWGYSYNTCAAAKHYPWTDPEMYTKQGSLFNADKIHTPLLLLHGKLDTNVPIGESIQIYNALKLLGREVEFVTVEDENHIITDFDRKQEWHNTIMAWFAKYLQDDPRWWNSLYGDK